MKARVVVPGVLLAASLVWVGARGLSQSLSYYVTPSELRSGSADARGPVRVGGQVEPGSVTQTSDGAVRFVLTDGTSSIDVVHRGDMPAMFRGGSGAIVEGALQADGTFVADTVLVKHSEVYRPPPEAG